MSPYVIPGIKNSRVRTWTQIDLNKKIEVALKYLDISMASLTSPSRVRELADARKLLCYYLHSKGFMFTRIGRALNRDHTSIIHNKDVMNDLMETDEQMKDRYEKFKSYMDMVS